jgi:hypothetical protein
MLEETLAKPWIVTTKTFQPRNEDEIKPISQDDFGVYISADSINEFHQNRKRFVQAYFHELVRGFVTKYANKAPGCALEKGNLPALSGAEQQALANACAAEKQAYYDQWVEYLTPRLFNGADRPGKEIAADLDKISNPGFVDRDSILEWMNERQPLERYHRICVQELKGERKSHLSRSEEKSLLEALKKEKPTMGITAPVYRNIGDDIGSMWTLGKLGYIYWYASRESGTGWKLHRPGTIENALYACANSDKAIQFLQRISQPLPDRLQARVTTFEEAIHYLNDQGRKLSSQRTRNPAQTLNLKPKARMTRSNETMSELNSSSVTAESAR